MFESSPLLFFFIFLYTTTHSWKIPDVFFLLHILIAFKDN